MITAASRNRKSALFGSDYIRTDRDNEYLIVSRVTHLLQNALEKGDRLAEIKAVHTNTELWIAFATDISSTENKLPHKLKIDLLSLAVFSIRHGHNVLSKNASIEPLLDINRQIMKGLRGKVNK